MSKDVYQIIDDLKINHFTKLPKGTKYSDLYIWITNNISRRMKEHNYSSDLWGVYYETNNSFIAREVESYYLWKWMQWWDWGWDNSAVFLYCYEIWPYTKE